MPGAPEAEIVWRHPDGRCRCEAVAGHGIYLLKRQFSADAGAECAGSSWHAMLLRDGRGGCYVMDLRSAAGTYVDGKRLEPQRPVTWDAGAAVSLGRPPLGETVTLRLLPGKRSRSAAAAEPDSKRTRRSSSPCDNSVADTATASSSSSSSEAGEAAKCDKCDKCDGPHPTEACPHFKKQREKHKDAWANYGQKQRSKQLGRTTSRLFLRSARPVPQPGDGSCLFHSLCFGLNRTRSQNRIAAGQLRRELADYISKNPKAEIAGDTLEEWVRWDTNASAATYARRMACRGWGGGIEMAVCSLLKKVNVHVYERRRSGGYERISCFDSPVRTDATIHILYQGGVHYDALIPS